MNIEVKEERRLALKRGVAEAITWRWVAEWFLRHSDDLWLRQVSWTDEGEALRVYAVRPTYQGHHADLPLSGQGAVRVYTSDWQVEIPGLWERSFESTSEDILDQLCTDLQLSCHHPPLPPPTRRILCYRVIAGLLGFTQFDGDAWQCTSVVGSPRVPGSLMLRDDLLDAFPRVAVKPPQHAYPPDSLKEEAFGYWAITRNGQPQVMLSEESVAYFPRREALDFQRLFERSQRQDSPDRIAPIVAAVGEGFLP